MIKYIVAISVLLMIVGCNLELTGNIEGLDDLRSDSGQFENTDTIYQTPDGMITLTVSFNTGKQSNVVYDMHHEAIEQFITDAEAKYNDNSTQKTMPE